LYRYAKVKKGAASASAAFSTKFHPACSGKVGWLYFLLESPQSIKVDLFLSQSSPFYKTLRPTHDSERTSQLQLTLSVC
jgi:hypothetical protein